MQSRRRTSALASTVSLAVAATLGVTFAPPAQAAPQDAATAAVTGLLDRLATDFLPQVASSSSLSQQLPTLAVTPAGSVGLKTAFSDALGSSGQLGAASSQATLDDLSSYLAGADGGGWTFTSSKPNDHTVTLGFTRTVSTDAGLDIRDQDGTLSLSTGGGIDVTGTLTGSFTFSYDAATDQASLTNPSISIATTADLPAGKTLNAGLGILGVKVVGAAGTADYTLSSNVTTAWANPDNDAAGALSFDNPGTAAADDGELAADGAGTGIVTATRTGTLAGHLVAEPRSSGLITGLPSVGATVDLTSTAPATFEAPAVTATVPDAAKPFLTMTPRDLAAGLSQAASAVLGMQNAEDGHLPLMRGSIANAVDAVGGIKAFLADQVPDADPSDHTPGQPKFASLQDLLAALDSAAYAESGWSIDVLGGADAATFDPATKKVGFTVRTTRGGVSDLELNVLGAPTSGTGTYTATGLSATGVDFDGPNDDQGNELVGRKVTAGGSYGTVASVTGDHALTLTADGWVNGQPANGTAFSVEAADPKTGAPELANTLEETTGIANANAEVSTATVTPDVVLTLPIALDLSAPLTYVDSHGDTVPDCDPDPTAEAPCPFKQVDESGLGRVITSLPLASDRVLLRQSARTLLVADAGISSPVQINATSGFLALTLGGDVDLTVPAGQHLQTLALTKTGDIPVPAFVEQVRQQAIGNADPADDVFTQTLGGAVKATVDVTVDDAPDAFADGEDSTSLTLEADVADLADGIDDGEVTVTPDDEDRADLLKALNFEPNNPTSLYGGVREAFKKAGSDLTTMTGGGLDVPIPLVGASVSQLIGAGASGADGVTYTQNAGPPATTTLTDPDGGFGPAFLGRQVVVGSTLATIVDQTSTTLVLAPQLSSEPADGTPYVVENELLGAVHVLQAMTPASLQEALGTAQSSLGHGSTIDFGLVKNDAGDPQLRLDLTWQREYHVAQPVSLEFGDNQLVGASAGGELNLTASGKVKLRLFLPLTAAAMLHPIDNTRVDENESKVELGVTLGADDAHLGASVGPISLDLGKGPDDLGSIHAGFGVEATGTTGEDTPSIGDFFSSGFHVGLTNGGACDDAGQILCADFPMYVNDILVPGGDLTVTTALGTGDNLTDVFTGTGTDVTLPTGLQQIIDGNPFKFDTLAQGLQQYLFYSETALRTASNNGELPVIGKDLQAGADFMGETRAKIDQFISENGDPSTVGGATTLLKTTLANKLGIVVNGPTGVQVGFTCKLVLEPPAAPTATATGAAAGDTTEYLYKVVSTYTHSPDPVKKSKPSDPTATTVVNAATLSATKYNTVTWTKATGATGYEILRATKTGTTVSAYTLVGTVADVATYDDKGTSSTAYTASTSNPLLPGTVCPDDTPVTKIEGVTLGMVLGQGDVSAADGCKDSATRGNCLGAKLPIDLGLPGLSLKTGDSGSVSGKVGWALDLKIGMSRSRGFYIDTSDTDELEVGAALKLDKAASGPDLKAQLAIINVDVTKNGDKSEFTGHFGIDLKDPGSNPDNALTLAEIARTRVADAITVSIGAKVDIDWHLAGAVDAALPGVSTDFKLTWAWGASTGTTPANTSGLKVKFDHVTLNAGEFFGKAIKPYLQQVVDATKPLQPVIDTIFTPMPVISDLSKAAGGDEITIATLAEKFSTIAGGPKIKPFLDAIKTVKQFLAGVKCDGSGCGVDIGSFELNPGRTATTGVSAGNAKSMIDTDPSTYKPATGASSAIAAKDTSGQMSNTAKRALAGLSFPVIDDPTLLFDLISGGDIPLVEFDSGPLTLGFQFQKSFGPIYAPPPVMMVIGGGASVSMRIAAGFDTYGIRRAIENGEAAQVLDSLYFKTVDKNGTPIPVVQFSGYLEAGASVSIGVLEVGVVGGIKLTVGFYWNDPNNDGKFRLFEFGAAVANNPICLFNVGGELSLYIKVFVTIGFSPFSVSFDFTLVNIKLLDFNLKPNCTPPPPRLAGTKDGVLYVFAGRFGGGGPRGDSLWAANNKNETWVVRQVPAYTDEDGAHAATVDVRGLGITESFPDTEASPITTVVLDGRGYTGNLTITFTGGSAPVKDAKPVAFTKKSVVFTGDGDDIIRTGEGDSWVDAGGGADNVTTLDRTDLSKAADSVSAHVAGGAGADTITVGNGKDTVTGDGSLRFGTAARTVDLAPIKPGTTSLGDPVDVASLQDPADADLFATNPAGSGNDQIAAGLGAVVLSGNGGVDTIGTANDSTLADSAAIKGTSSEPLYRGHASVLVGGAGGDVMKSGSANDKVYTGAKSDIDEFATGSGDDPADRNTVDTGAGSDTVYGSNGIDFVTTHSTTAQKAIVYGGGADDVLTGGQGSDEIYGGPGDDYVVAAPATVGDPGSATDVLGAARTVGVLPGASTSTKKLVGGTGSDRIYGSDGPSTIFGDTTTDACPVQSDPVSKQPAESNVAGDAADLILGGNGVDVVNAGGAGDWVYAAGAADRVCGNAGDDHLYGGDDADLVYGGSGADQGYGEAGADQVYGNDGGDSLYGGAGADRLQGNDGADWLDGGSEADVLLGGTSKAGQTDTADVLLGAGGADVLVGDNATTDVLADAPYPADLGSSVASLGGNDYLVGGDQDDGLFGGLADDTGYGGNGDDDVEGNPGSDRLYGEAGDDDVVGGSSQLASGLFTGSEPGRPDTGDFLYGGAGQDVIAGDNARMVRGATAHPVSAGRGLTTSRAVDLADEGAGTPAGVAGGDLIQGGNDTDVVFGQRGDDDVSLGEAADYGEGGPGVDLVHGDGGDDDIVGGSYTPVSGTLLSAVGQPDAGDTLAGDAGEDVVLGDNGALTRPATLTVPLLASPLTLVRLVAQRQITPYDLGDAPAAGTSGADDVTGGADSDVLLGQGGNDSVDGGAQDDYAEGGQGTDLVRGGTEDDDLAGGSSATTASNAAGAVGQLDGADDVYGGAGSDLVIGDNGLLTRVTTGRDWRTNRANAGQSALVPGRGITLFDLNGAVPATANANHSGADALSGQTGVDVILGQDGNDRISGGGDDDYAEGDGGADAIHGDAALGAGELVAAPAVAAWVTPAVDAASVTEGQDDLAGGWSKQAYRDGDDAIHGDGEDDFVVGDNGSIARVLDGTVERVYTQRYGASRTGDAKVRVAGGGATSTRFCPTTGSSATATCEVSGAFGADTVYGDAGQDVLYGQDGGDTVWGGADDDDLYGELGADLLYGQDGEDAILGDRGGIQDRYETGARSTTTTLNQPPAETLVTRRSGSVSREADLLHDVNGTDFTGSASSAPMPLDGISYGGADRIRGGDGHDSIHAGAGDDLANGDTGGDYVFGDRGADVLWGGLGRACAPTDAACQADRGATGEWVDHLVGGKDNDVIDWRPRGVYGTGPAFTGRTCTTGTAPVTTKKDGTTDPCSWFEMTGRDDDVTSSPATFANNQHHQGVDWVYGGWDRDVMQGDQAGNGPNPGDRLIDWSGVYNLYSHCNAAYGGFNDLRSPSPAIQDFLQKWATGLGAGRPGATPDVLTPGTSAYDELALVTTADGKGHGTGSAYPTTPGHFDDANACSGF
ncbi:MAG: hypothetical protein J7518_11850 [Nocardioidaceae bacterium]|nr:hypothetical protein [Nocardioidaceae bacterium]